MLSSVLLHLDQGKRAEAVIRQGVALALANRARVRGLTLVDTRRVESALSCETAVYAVVEQRRTSNAESRQQEVRFAVSQACLQAGLDFDVRHTAGDPLRILPQEAKFHDLVITAVDRDPAGESDPHGLSPRDLVTLLERGAEPLMVVHADQASVQRVLLLYDGGEASGRAIRSFLNLGILPWAEHRLLGIGKNRPQSRVALREMADYCLPRLPGLETGCLAGRPRRVLLNYAQKWQADLIVWGVGRGSWLWRRLLGEPALGLWHKLPCGLFITT
jgi:nucleotide-binding universal stress UspA family protein